MKAVYIQQHAPLRVCALLIVPNRGLIQVRYLYTSRRLGSTQAIAEGRFPGAVLPRIIGRDFERANCKGPDEFIGAEVWGTGGDLGIIRDGTHAEYVAIPEEAVTRRPANLAVEEAVIAGVPFVTAFSAVVRLGQVRQGEW